MKASFYGRASFQGEIVDVVVIFGRPQVYRVPWQQLKNLKILINIYQLSTSSAVPRSTICSQLRHFDPAVKASTYMWKSLLLGEAMLEKVMT